MANIEYLDDYRRTYVVHDDAGVAHIVPEAALDRIAETGEVLPDMRPVLRRIIEEWKAFVDG
ncbi:hypothetical protein D6833_04925 [Candidatus Parcubacteria bacterium]|nr:MAG: hypothetical protein D6833_04925 [Candidatus Parcubacteria bacterium]